MADDITMMWQEVADIGGLLHELDDEAFDAPSLCEGWAVRDVLGHMGTGHTTPFSESKEFLRDRSADDIRRFWDDVMVAQHARKGIARLIPAKAEFLDHLIHNQDIRRPTGKARQIPEARLRHALELVRAEGNPLFNPKKNVAGLKLGATDLAWSAGEGPVVEGPGEAIVLAAAGRKVALADVTGDGVIVLKERLGA